MLSVIIPIFNEEKYIAKCIESVLSQDYPLNDLELLLVDGMSTDKTRDIIKTYIEKYNFIKLLDNPKRIAPCAMNIGIRASKGDIIIRLDAHVIFPTNYLSVLVRNLEELNADNVGGVCNTLPVNDSIVCKSIAAALSNKFGMGNSYFRIGANNVIEVDTVPFGCFRRELFDRIGYFDEELVRNQDDEFNARITQNGGKIYLIPTLSVNYYARDTIKKVYNMFYQYGLFKPLVCKKLGKPSTIRQFIPLFFVLYLICGGIMSICFSKLRLIYFIGILIYLLASLYFSSKDSKNLKQIATQVWTFFVIHFSYGWGYIVGMYKILFHRHFVAKANR